MTQCIDKLDTNGVPMDIPLLRMPNILARNLIRSFTTFWGGHDIEHVCFGIHNKVVDDKANTWEHMCNLSSRFFLLLVMYGPAQPHDTEAWVDSDREITSTFVTS